MSFLKKSLTVLGWSLVGLVVLSIVGSIAVIIVAIGSGFDDTELSSLKVKSDNAVGLVELTGEIVSSDKFRESLGKFVKNDKIKAVVVRIETPGGAVGASEEIYRAIKLADAKKPVVCSLGNIAASGGMYASAGCRSVVTNQGTLTGSIGVILQVPNVSSLIEKYGFSMHVIKSGRFKDSGSPFREFEVADKELLQNIVDKTYEQFVNIIADSRKLEVDKVREFADGRIILGEQAVEWGLADEIGGVARAAKLALELSGEEEAEPDIVKVPKVTGLLALIEGMNEARAVQWLRSIGKLQLLYRAY